MRNFMLAFVGILCYNTPTIKEQIGLVINFAGTQFGKSGIARVILKDANKPTPT